MPPGRSSSRKVKIAPLGFLIGEKQAPAGGRLNTPAYPFIGIQGLIHSDPPLLLASGVRSLRRSVFNEVRHGQKQG